MSFDLKIDIRRLIGKTYADRGQVYAKQGRVTDFSGADGRRLLFGEVRGSGHSIYSQTISLDWSADGRLTGVDGECTCPVDYNCKHVAAVLFVAEPLLRDEDAPILMAHENPRKQTPKLIRQTLSRPLQVWLDTRPKADVPAAPDDYPATVQDRIYYVLNRERDHLAVQPYKVRLKKDGTPGKGARRYDFGTVNSQTPPKFIRPIDLRIMRYLKLSDWYPGFQSGTKLPDGEEGRKTFELLLSTGRTRWQDRAGISLVEGSECVGRFAWHQDSAGTQTLQVETAAGRTVTPLPLWPLWYFDPGTGVCGALKTDLPPGCAIWLAAAPPVPAREAGQFVKTLGALDKAALPLPRRIGTITCSDSLPAPVVRLHAERVQTVNIHDWRHYRPRPDPEEVVPALSCSFDYKGARV